jgi:glycosyltransferase involved in cell wall biosynthesis
MSASKRIVYIQYTNPAAYPPLERSSRFLADDGWDVLVLGLLRPGTEALRFPPHSRISERYLFNATNGWRLRMHYVWFVAWVLSWTLRWRAGWVYASDLLSCPIALLISLVPWIRIVYHEHDEPAPRKGLIARAQRSVRQIASRRADLRVLPNAARADFFEQTVSGGKPTLRVWNCPSATEVGPPRHAHSSNGHRLCVVYSGSVTPGRLPLALLQAMASLPGRVRLRVVGYATIGYPDYIEELQDAAKELCIAPDVEFLGVMPRHQLHAVWSAADVGLALHPTRSANHNTRWMVGASNKPFDYMANGLALLVSDVDEWRQTFVATGYGIASDPDDPASLTNALHWLVEHPAETRAMGERGRQQIATRWNYETEFAPVMAQLDGLATKGRWIAHAD